VNTYILNATEGGLEISSILCERLKVTGYIGLANSPLNEKNSGYSDGIQFCRSKKVIRHEISSYNFNNNDLDVINKLDIDILIVAGWQRLVPNQLISSCKVVLGIHGSPLGITRGRGRSPQNWALIRGWKQFDLSIFKIMAGIDDGPVLATCSFSYNLRDNIHTSYLKSSYMAASEIVRLISSEEVWGLGVIQDEDNAEYFPQRISDDGIIDWNQNPALVVDMVRALTKPYPGAFSYLGKKKVYLWDCSEFTDCGFENEPFGKIIHQFISGELLIKCGSGAVIVSNHSVERLDLTNEIIFLSKDAKATEQEIIDRHMKKHPELPVSSELFK